MDDAERHKNLGKALKQQGRFIEAEASFRRALEVKPDYAEAHSNLGDNFKARGLLVEAEASYRRALEIRPDYAEVYNNLGVILKEQGRLSEAEASYRRALTIKPGFAVLHNNLGVTLEEQGRLSEAEASYRRALAIKQDNPDMHSNLARTLRYLGRLSEAEASYRRALAINSNFAEGHNNLGVTLQEQGRLYEAETSLRRALVIKPDYVEAYNNLGNIFKDEGRLSEAEASYRKALNIKPDYADAHNNLGNIFKLQGRLDEAEASYRCALEINPDYVAAHSNLLFALNYAACHHPSYHFEEAVRYGQNVAKKVKPFLSWRCMLHPDRLRVGLVSGDLRNHPVGFFLESVLAQIDPSHIELIVYATDNRVDELTARIKPHFSAWKSLVGLNDETAASLIHADGIHLLLDLSGHTANNRLPVFAWKPAPVQASWLGYFATTGVVEIDYLIGDPYITPTEEAGYFTETVWRLPESYICFTPPEVSLEVEPLPALSSGCITFGSFNNITKMNDAVVTLWAKILNAVPDSRLFLKTKQLNDLGVVDTTRQRFAAYGITSDRLILEGNSPRAELLAAYNRVDVALDPFPYPGGTTSVEGLWMGVPVITHKGDFFLSHIGESIAHNAGLPDWIADNDDDYVVKAVLHSEDLNKLASLRTGLRQQVLASPLFDAARFARHFEAAVRGMWERWVTSQRSSGKL